MNHSTMRLRMALHLQSQYADIHTPPSTPNLPELPWEQVQRLCRQLQLAQRHRWPAAAAICRRQLHAAAQQLQQDLSRFALELQRSPPVRPVPSLRLLEEELRGLEDEFAHVRFDLKLKEVCVRTERMVLEEIDLGPFEIRLEVGQLATDQPYRVIALDPEPSGAHGDVTHPHLQRDRLCEGEGKQAIARAIAEGRLGDLFVAIRQILRTYNADSAYASLDDWNGLPCIECGDRIPVEDETLCDNCSSSLCDGCCRGCERCSVLLCGNCTYGCDECDSRCCDDCVTECEQCGRTLCSHCLESSLCDTCEAEQEPNPPTSNQDPADAQPEDSPSVPASSPSPPTETDKTSPPSHAPVHPDRMGEAPVPA